MRAPGPVQWDKFPKLTAWLNQLREFTIQGEIQSATGYNINRTTGGTSLVFRRSGSDGGAGGAAGDTPFLLYQFTPSPSVPASDWRTIRILAGTVNDQHPVNDDSQPTPITIVVPAETSLYKVWLDCDIITAAGATQGTIPTGGVTIAHGAAGWSGYPAQPAGDSGTGAPPAKLYILLGEVTTSDDTAKVLTLVQNIFTALRADMVAFDLSCSGVELILQKRMTVGRT